MSRKEKARQKSSTDITEGISLIHWTGTIDPSWEPGNSVIKDKVPRLDENGSMVYRHRGPNGERKHRPPEFSPAEDRRL
jgi:hypothetical protein